MCLVVSCSYSISAAFAKCQIELYIAAFLQRRFKKSPNLFLLAIMMMGLFLSMWISNHTAPVLCVSVGWACAFGCIATPLTCSMPSVGAAPDHPRFPDQQSLCQDSAHRPGVRLQLGRHDDSDLVAAKHACGVLLGEGWLHHFFRRMDGARSSVLRGIDHSGTYIVDG